MTVLDNPLEVDLSTLQQILSHFDTDSTNFLNPTQIKKCYETISGIHIHQNYLNDLIFQNLCQAYQLNPNAGVDAANLHNALNYYNSIVKFLETAHVEHEILSHNADVMNFKTSRAFVELAIKTALNDSDWLTFQNGRFEPDVPFITWNEIEPIVAAGKLGCLDLKFIRDNAKRVRKERIAVAQMLGLVWNDDIMNSENELDRNVEDFDGLAGQLLADYLKSLYGKDFDRDKLLAYLQARKDAKNGRLGRDAANLLNDKEMADAMAALKRKQFEDWLKNKRNGLNKQQHAELEKQLTQQDLELVIGQNELDREDPNYNGLAGDLLADYLKSLYGKDFDREKLLAYLQARKDAKNGRLGQEAANLLNDKQMADMLAALKRKKFEDWLKNKRAGLTKEQLAALENLETQQDLDLVIDNTNLVKEDPNYNGLAGKILADYLKNLHGKDFDRQALMEYLQAKKDAKNGRLGQEAADLLKNQELAEAMDVLKRKEFEDWLRQKKSGLSREQQQQIEDLATQEDLAMVMPEIGQDSKKESSQEDPDYRNMAGNLLAEYLKTLHGKDFDCEQLLKYLEFKKDALHDKNNSAAALLLNDKDLADKLANLKRQDFEKWLKNKRSGLSKPEQEMLDQNSEIQKEISAIGRDENTGEPSNKKARNVHTPEINENYDLLAANLMKDYLKTLYGEKEYDQDKLQAYLQFKKDALLDRNSKAAQLLMGDKELQDKLRKIQKQKFADYVKDRKDKLSKSDLAKLKEQEETLLMNVKENFSKTVGSDYNLRMAPSVLWVPKPAEEVNQNFDQQAADLLVGYLATLYNKNPDMDAQEKLQAYLQFKKDALNNRNSHAAQALLHDQEMVDQLKNLQKKRFDEYLKGRRSRLSKEELEKLTQQQENSLLEGVGEPWNLKMASNYVWENPAAAAAEKTPKSAQEINENFDEQAAELLKNHLQKLYGDDYKKDKMAAYLKFRMDALKDKNSEAYKILHDNQKYAGIQNKLKELQRAKMAEYLKHRRKNMTAKEIQQAENAENVLLLGVEEEVPKSNNYESFKELILKKHFILNQLGSANSSTNETASSDLKITPEILSKQKVNSKFYGEKLIKFNENLIKYRSKAIWPNISIPAGLFIGNDVLEKDHFSKPKEEKLMDYVDQEYEFFEKEVNSVSVISTKKLVVNVSFQILQISLLEEQFKFLRALKSQNSGADSTEIDQIRFQREAILTNLGSRIKILQAGTPLCKTDLRRYLLAFNFDQKLELDFELCERPPRLTIIESSIDLIPQDFLTYILENDTSNFYKNSIEILKSDIKLTMQVLVNQYRSHYQERRSLLATLTDPNSQSLREEVKSISFSGRQERLLEINKLTSEIEKKFGAGKFYNSAELIEMSDYSNRETVNNDSKITYEDLFDEAGALAFVQTKQYLHNLNKAGTLNSKAVSSEDADVITFLLSELRNEQDRQRSILLNEMERIGQNNNSNLANLFTEIYQTRYKTPLIPNAFSILCRVKLPNLEDFYLIRAACLPYEISKIHIYSNKIVDISQENLKQAEKLRNLENLIKLNNTDLNQNDEMLVSEYQASELNQSLNSSEKIWKIIQLSLKSRFSQNEMLKLTNQHNFTLEDRNRFIAWSHKLAGIVNLFPDTGKIINFLIQNEAFITSLMAGRHAISDHINYEIIEVIEKSHMIDSCELSADRKSMTMSEIILLKPHFLKDNNYDNLIYNKFLIYHFQELIWLYAWIKKLNFKRIQIYSEQSNIQDLWQELARSKKSSKIWNDISNIPVTWAGIDRTLEIRAAIEVRQNKIEPGLGLLKVVWEIQNIMYEKWVNLSEKKKENLVVKLDKLMAEEKSISIAILLSKQQENDHLDEALIRAMLKQNDNAAFYRLNEKERHEEIQRQRLEYLKAKKLGTTSETIRNLMTSLDNDKSYQLANRLKQKEKMDEILRVKKRILEQGDNNTMDIFNSETFSNEVDKILKNFCKNSHLPDSDEDIQEIRVALSKNQTSPVIQKLDQTEFVLDKFRAAKQNHLKEQINFYITQKELGKINKIFLQKQEKQLKNEIEYLPSLFTASEILKLDPELEALRILTYQSNEKSLENNVNKAEENEIKDSIQNKADIQKDNLIANLLISKYGESQWNALAEQDRRNKVLQARLELQKDRRRESLDQMSSDAQFIMNELNKNQDLKNELMKGQQERLKNLLEEKKKVILEGKLTEEEADKVYLEEKEKLEEITGDANNPKNVLKLIQIDADGEKRRILSDLSNATNARARERQRQLELGKQRILAMNAKKDATEDAIFQLLGDQNNAARSTQNEKQRQRKLAKQRLDLYRKRKQDMNEVLANENILLTTEELEKSDQIPVEITKLVEVWQSEELKTLLQILDPKNNDFIADVYEKGLTSQQLATERQKLSEKWNASKNSSSAKTRSWKSKRDAYLAEAAAYRLVEASMLATEKSGANLDEKQKFEISQKSVEQARLDLVSELETAHKRLRFKIAESLQNSKKLQSKENQLNFYKKLDLERAYHTNLGVILLGKHIDIKIQEQEIDNENVIVELEQKYDVAKFKIIEESLAKILGSEEAVKNIPDKESFIAKIIERMDLNEDESVLKASRYVAKSDSKWDSLKSILKEIAAQNKANTAAKSEEKEIKNKLKEINQDFSSERDQLMLQLQNARDATQRERLRQLQQAKLRKEKKQLQKEDNIDQVALLLQANKLSGDKKAELRKIQLEMAKKRLAALESKKKRKNELKIIEKKLFDPNVVLEQIKQTLVKANSRPGSATSGLSKNDSMAESLADSVISKSDWLDAEHDREKDFILSVKDIYDDLAEKIKKLSTPELDQKLSALSKTRQATFDQLLESAIDRNVRKQASKLNDDEGFDESTILIYSNLDLQKLAEQQVKLNKIYQEAILVRNELKVRSNSPDYNPWENLIVDVNSAQDIETSVHEEFENDVLLDKILIESVSFEALNQVMLLPSPADSDLDTDAIQTNIRDMIQKVSKQIATKLLNSHGKDQNKINNVQKMLAERRLQNAQEDEQFDHLQEDTDANNFRTSEDGLENLSPENQDKLAQLSNNEKFKARPSKGIKRRNSIGMAEKQTTEEAEKKLQELKAAEELRRQTMVRQKTKLSEQLARRKTQILMKKDKKEMEVVGAADDLMKSHKEAETKQKEQLERQKTMMLKRTQTLVRERTMIKREKTMVRESQNTEKSQQFDELDNDEAKRKADELQKRFSEKLKGGNEIAAKVASQTLEKDGQVSDIDDIYAEANKEPEFEPSLKRGYSKARKVASDDARKKTLQKSRRSRNRKRNSSDEDEENSLNSSGNSGDEQVGRRRQFIDPDAVQVENEQEPKIGKKGKAKKKK